MKSESTRRLRVWGAAVLLTLLAACASVQQPGTPPAGERPSTVQTLRTAAAPLGAHDSEGATIARHLQERYDDTVDDCRKNANDPNPLPALLCSGVLMRFTKRGSTFDVWNPNPNSKTPNGVSFAWQRKGSAFSRTPFGYSDGFTVLPHFYADSPADGYTQLVVLCAFAFDAASNGRTDADSAGTGCGSYPGIANSGPCQAQGVVSAATWLAKFQNGGSRYTHQCGFDLRRGTVDAYKHFAAIYAIRQALSTEIALHTEVKISPWPQDDSHLPLEAFIYTAVAGLADAKLNQNDYVAHYRRWVPIIKVTLPTSVSGASTFAFNPGDQQVP